jgi:hypothetical protein
MQGTPPPRQVIPQPSKVASKYGDGPEVWNQTQNQGQIPNQGQYQIPLQPGMAMGYFPTTNATLALVLSVLGIVGCSIFTAIPGLIMANIALQTTKSMPGHPDEGIAKAAQVVAWISIGLAIVGMLLFGAPALLMVATSGGF